MERGERATRASPNGMERNSGLAYKKYTLGLPGTINELGVRGQRPRGTVQVDFKKQGPCRGMIMSCRGMSDMKGTSQKFESSMPRHAHSMPRHEFGSMPQHD